MEIKSRKENYSNLKNLKAIGLLVISSLFLTACNLVTKLPPGAWEFIRWGR